MDLEKSTGCEKCVQVCKVGAASVVDGKAVIDYDKCVMCGRCVVNCPVGGSTPPRTGTCYLWAGAEAGRHTRAGCCATSWPERRSCP